MSVLPNREKKTVKKFLRSIPQRLRDTIHTVCTDMYQHYIDAVKEEWGDEVRIVVDRYHVAKKYRDCADGDDTTTTRYGALHGKSQRANSGDLYRWGTVYNHCRIVAAHY